MVINDCWNRLRVHLLKCINKDHTLINNKYLEILLCTTIKFFDVRYTRILKINSVQMDHRWITGFTLVKFWTFAQNFYF